MIPAERTPVTRSCSITTLQREVAQVKRKMTRREALRKLGGAGLGIGLGGLAGLDGLGKAVAAELGYCPLYQASCDAPDHLFQCNCDDDVYVCGQDTPFSCMLTAPSRDSRDYVFACGDDIHVPGDHLPNFLCVTGPDLWDPDSAFKCGWANANPQGPQWTILAEGSDHDPNPPPTFDDNFVCQAITNVYDDDDYKCTTKRADNLLHVGYRC
jgi:hypothetical protein